MNEGISRRKRTLIVILSSADIVFGATTIGIYLYIVLGLNEYLDFPVDTDISSCGVYSRIIETLNSVFLVSINCVQVIFASILFANLIQRRSDFIQSLQKSYNWLQVTKLIYILLCVKITLIFMYFFIPPKNDAIATLTISLPKTTNNSHSKISQIRLILRFVLKIMTIMEWAFKSVTIYSMEKFLDELYNRYYSHIIWLSLFSTEAKQRHHLDAQSELELDIQNELKYNLFWINYKNKDIRDSKKCSSSGNLTRMSHMATGSSTAPSHSRSEQMGKEICLENLCSSKHFCVISSPAVKTVDGNGPSTSAAASNVPTSHHI